MEVVAAVFSLAGLVALGKQLMNWLKVLRARDWNAVITQALSWAVGVGLFAWAAHARLMSGVEIIKNDPRLGSVTIGSLDGGSLVFAGFALGSLMSAVYDNTKAKDNTQSAATPPLIPQSQQPSSVLEVAAAPPASNVYLQILAAPAAAPEPTPPSV